MPAVPFEMDAARFEMDAARLEIGDIRLLVVFPDGAAGAVEYAALERAARRAGFEEEVVAVWPDQSGRTHFFARPERHAFFEAVGYDQLRAQINAKLELA